MADGITNDPEIEKNGCNAAGDYALLHWATLQRLVQDDAVPAESIELTPTDRRLYRCFRASISEPVDELRPEQLKTALWRDLLTCMQGRVDDFNFMTLLRPDASRSYDEQKAELFVVPRAQFVMIELARLREGCYGAPWRAARRAADAREAPPKARVPRRALPAGGRVEVVATAKFAVVSRRGDDREAFEAELAARLEGDANAAAARAGGQLDECVAPREAAARLPLGSDALPATLAAPSRERPVVVVEGALSPAACKAMTRAALAYFDAVGSKQIASQLVHRTDDVAFLPLFGDEDASPLLEALRPARTLLANAAAAVGWAGLRVPETAQLALYDGLKNERPRYCPHTDNDPVVGGPGENYRELTLLVYLNGAPPGASGGELTCFEGKDRLDVAPRPGTLALFRSRDVLHAVRPVKLWRRVALSLWCLEDTRDRATLP
jgi:hypothetical protein